MSMPMPIDLHECDASENIFCALLLGDPYRQGFVPTRKKVPCNTMYTGPQLRDSGQHVGSPDGH